MSYSRWGESSWYAFWNANSGDTRDEQVLCLWYSLDETYDWTYADLVNITVADILDAYKHVSEDDAVYAYKIVQRFLKDIEGEFDEG